MSPANRDVTVDLTKFVAIFMVIVIHDSGGVFYSLPIIQPATWFTVAVYNALAQIAVPLFVVVSGALLLDPSKKESLTVFLKKRFIRIAPAFFFWTMIYFWWRSFARQEILTLDIIFRDTLSGAFYHFWFIYMMASLYLLTPILRVFVANAQRKVVYYAVALSIFGSYVLPVIRLLTGYGLNSEFFLLSSFVGFYLLGYLLKTERFATWKLLAAYVGSVVLSVIGFYWLAIAAQGQNDVFVSSVVQYLGAYSPTTMLMCISAYSLLRKINFTNSRLVKFVSLVGTSTLSMYFSHILILEILQGGYLGFKINEAVINPVLEIPLISILTFAITLGIALIGKLFRILLSKISYS